MIPATTSPITRGWPSSIREPAEQARHEHDHGGGDQERRDGMAERLALLDGGDLLAGGGQADRVRGGSSFASSSGMSWRLLRLRSTACALRRTLPPLRRSTSPVTAPTSLS